MGRKKKIPFKLNPEWLLKEPIDFEYNKYTLLGYLQKCEERFNNFEIYPDFIELSLHVANIQTIFKENKFFLTNKKFDSCDDEILLGDLLPKNIRALTSDEKIELSQTLRFSMDRLLDAFNFGKSIWGLAFENINIFVRRNIENISNGQGYSFFYKKDTNEILFWEFYMKKNKNYNYQKKIIFKEIYRGNSTEYRLSEIIENFSSFNKTKFYKNIPIFEIKSSQLFPIEQTLVPIMKRKIQTYINQSLENKQIGKFDY